MCTRDYFQIHRGYIIYACAIDIAECVIVLCNCKDNIAGSMADIATSRNAYFYSVHISVTIVV